ncbi:hypothetical protein [Vreelandella sedimenti]|uniref:hypothetical protein n=1 Tax=Vreelandella TaxID=3137766 RepID=UPI00257C2B84|nr:hypothetical protein [Halomonas sp. UBA3173]|tara:strand:- start:45450 stop:46112 length:663 start_codon:yes stop_codon:yes gene_type:complete
MATKNAHEPSSFYDRIDTGVDTRANVVDPRGFTLGTIFLKSTSKLGDLNAGFTIESDLVSPIKCVTDADPQPGEHSMSTQDRYVDARLAGIESKLDARVESMQRFQEQADARFERITDRLYDEITGLRNDVTKESENSRRHATTTAWATVAGVFAGFAIVIAVAGYWISEQGSYAKSYGETQVEIQRAADERSEFREAVNSIQATQESILERLPTSTATQ